MNEQEFRKHADSAMEDLKQRLLDAEGSASAEFEVEEQGGAIHVSFDEPPGRFVISPNAAAGQIWISALSTSFKLDWSGAEEQFVLAKSGENLKTLVARLMNQQLGSEAVSFE